MRLMTVKGWNGRRAIAVQLKVSPRRFAAGIDVDRPGAHLFRGAWYGRDLGDIDTYGKVEGRCGMPIGKLSGRPAPYLLRKLGARTTRIWVDEERRDRLRNRRTASAETAFILQPEDAPQGNTTA